MKNLNNTIQSSHIMRKVSCGAALLMTLMGAVPSVQAMLADGDYRIFCDTKNGVRKHLEAFPWRGKVQLETLDVQNQDQEWNVKHIGGNKYRISCDTKRADIKYMEACPISGKVKPASDKHYYGNYYHPEQVWEIMPSGGAGKFKISCITQGGSERYLEAFPRLGTVKPEKHSPGSTNQDLLWQFALAHAAPIPAHAPVKAKMPTGLKSPLSPTYKKY